MIPERTKELLEKYNAIKKSTGGRMHPDLYDITNNIINSIDISKISKNEAMIFSDIPLNLGHIILILNKVNNPNKTIKKVINPKQKPL